MTTINRACVGYYDVQQISVSWGLSAWIYRIDALRTRLVLLSFARIIESWLGKSLVKGYASYVVGRARAMRRHKWLFEGLWSWRIFFSNSKYIYRSFVGADLVSWFQIPLACLFLNSIAPFLWPFTLFVDVRAKRAFGQVVNVIVIFGYGGNLDLFITIASLRIWTTQVCLQNALIDINLTKVAVA